jgi:methylated-DNA-[protein]-cysteine S-methyltransferase
VEDGPVRWAVTDSPIGELSVGVDDAGVCGVRFGRVDAERSSGEPLLQAAIGELRSYFAGELAAFTVPLSVRGGGDFDRAVWREMLRIPFGEMRTYGQVAAVVSGPDAARAVGLACNRNPIPVIIPCHRIVGVGGKLVGFGGGLHRKRYLLELEASVSLMRAWTWASRT